MGTQRIRKKNSLFSSCLEFVSSNLDDHVMIREKTDSDLTKFFTNDLNSNLTENNAIKKTNLNESKISKNSKNKTIFHDTLRSLTPPSYIKNYQNYNAFDYEILYDL